jgi:AcrR family transcriptional regulator
MGEQRNERATRRSTIADAAAAVFADLGFESASVEDIRRLSGASVGSIYHHFGTKGELASAVVLQAHSEFCDELLTALTEAQTVEQSIRAAAALPIVRADRDPRCVLFSRGYVGGLLRGRWLEDFAATNQRILHSDDEWMTPFVNEMLLHDFPASIYLSIWCGPSREFVSSWATSESPRSEVAAAIAQFGDLAWSASAVAPPALSSSS